jgi:hypothetical protein
MFLIQCSVGFDGRRDLENANELITSNVFFVPSLMGFVEQAMRHRSLILHTSQSLINWAMHRFLVLHWFRTASTLTQPRRLRCELVSFLLYHSFYYGSSGDRRSGIVSRRSSSSTLYRSSCSEGSSRIMFYYENRAVVSESLPSGDTKSKTSTKETLHLGCSWTRVVIKSTKMAFLQGVILCIFFYWRGACYFSKK